MKKIVVLSLIIVFMSFSCSRKNNSVSETSQLNETPVELNVFVASSLKNAMDEIKSEYKKEKPYVNLVVNCDSSGLLMNQILAGFDADVFFSASNSQVNVLKKNNLVVQNSDSNIVRNKLVLFKKKDQPTDVKSINDIGKASSVAIPAPSVPAGNYTREAFKRSGFFSSERINSDISTLEISVTFDDVEICEASNVSKAVLLVLEGSCEVGTGYLSDIYGFEDKLEIIEVIPESLTGIISYPACRIVKAEENMKKTQEAIDFIDFLGTEKAKSIFKSNYFDVD